MAQPADRRCDHPRGPYDGVAGGCRRKDGGSKFLYRTRPATNGSPSRSRDGSNNGSNNSRSRHFCPSCTLSWGDEDFEDRLLEALDQCSELIVLLTPEALQRPYVWMELGAVWKTRKRASVILYRLAVEDLRKRSEVPLFLLKSELIAINRDTERFLKQLQARFRASRTRR